MLYDLKQETLAMQHGFKKQFSKAYFPNLRIWESIETHKNVDLIIVNSENSKKYISEIYKKPLIVLYPGVDDKYFRIKNEPENKVLIVNRLVFAKRIDLSIKSFAKSDNKDLKLEIIGKGPEEQNLKLLVKSLGLKNVIFRGQISEKELIKAYSQALMVLYTPIREMFGIVPIEAMAAGVPVIATNEGGPRETIIDGKTGYLVEADKNRIAEKINQLKISDIRMYMSEQAKYIARKFTWNNVAKQTIKIFQSII